MGNKVTIQDGPYKNLTPAVIELLKEMTYFSERDIREWHAGFFDDCPSGILDYDQFKRTFEQYYVTGDRANSFCKYIFQLLDKDNSGTIDFVEFLLAIASNTQGELDDRLGLAFDMYNVSGDDSIDQDELATLISAMYDIIDERDRKGDRDPKTYARKIIADFRKDGGTKFTKSEFIKACKKDEGLIKMLAPYHEKDERPRSSRSDTQV